MGSRSPHGRPAGSDRPAGNRHHGRLRLAPAVPLDEKGGLG